MGAALLPAIIAPLIGAAVQSVFAPPAPKQTVIQPAPISPALSSDQAAQIAKTTEQKGQEFGSQLLNSILSRAKTQGVGEKELGSIKDQFNTWFSENQDEINKSMALMAAHSKAQADYQNTIQNQNFGTQMQALNASQPQSGGLGHLAGGLASALLSGGGLGMFGGSSVPYNPPPNMISGPDTSSFLG